MPNLIWPRETRSDLGASGMIGRTVHWLGVLMAVAFLIIALGFAADGWSTSDAIWLTVVAVVMAMGARGVRYLLARE
jgi:hypothetical protein